MTCGATRGVQVMGDLDGGWVDGGSRVDGGIPMGSDAGLPQGAACALLNVRRCEALARCGLLNDGGVGACETTLARTWCGPGTWPPHVAAGALRYDGVAAKSCADDLLVRPCSSLDELPASCLGFLRPAAGLRALCFDGFAECTDGVCRGAACPRTCQPRGLMGEVCASDADCRTTLYCRLSTTTPGVGQCEPWGQTGDGCDPSTKCANPLVCAQNVCKPLPVTTETCLLGQCSSDALCQVTADAGVCVHRPSVGEACMPSQCQAGLVCDTISAKCVAQVVDVAMAPCTVQQQCSGTQACVGASVATPGRCRAPLVSGETCTRDLECAPELACLPTDGGRACGRRLEAGSACSTDRWCQVDAVCRSGLCKTLPGPGEPCTDKCRVGTCLSNTVDGGLVCGPFLGPGAHCTEDSQCESQKCALGTCLTQCTP